MFFSFFDSFRSLDLAFARSLLIVGDEWQTWMPREKP